MTGEAWPAVDAYFEEKLLPDDPILREILRSSEAAGLPRIHVSPTQGKLLYLLAKAQGARRILEVGTLGGYSTTWLARALPEDGHLVSLELNPKHVEVARANLDRAGVRTRVEVRPGPALDSLGQLAAEASPPFDMFFIDADRPNTRTYFEWALRLSRPGSLIVIDNVVRRGELVNPVNAEPDVRGMRELFDALATDPRVSATAIQTVGRKGYDGFLLARVSGEAPPRSLHTHASSPTG